MDEKHLPPSFSETLRQVIKICLPAIIGMVSSFSMHVINTSLCGHLGDQAVMAGVGMATMFSNIFCNSLMMGLNSTLDTLISQAKGFGDLHLCGVYLNRARIALTLMFIPLAILLLNTERVFLLLGFDPLSSMHSQVFINAYLPAMYFMGLSDVNRRFLVNMGYQMAPMYIQLGITTFHIVLCTYLTGTLGVFGTGLSMTISHSLNLFCLHMFT